MKYAVRYLECLNCKSVIFEEILTAQRLLTDDWKVGMALQRVNPTYLHKCAECGEIYTGEK